MNTVLRFATVVNKVVKPLVLSPRWGYLVSRWMTVVTYTGRRSGRTFHLPVGYVRHGDHVRIGVQLPGQKTWWRNFSGQGAPLSVRLGGIDRPGHGVLEQHDGAVTVVITLHAQGQDTPTP